jgi:hypothetical protein
MKLRKVLAIVIACAMFAGLSLTATAATKIDLLGNDTWDWPNDPERLGWHTDGFDEGDDGIVESVFTLEQLKAAKYFVIEVSEVGGAFESDQLVLVWQSQGEDGGGQGWNQKGWDNDDVRDGNIAVLPLAEVADRAGFDAAIGLKLMYTNWNQNIDDQNIVAIYLTDTAPEGGGNGGGNGENGENGTNGGDNGGVDGDKKPPVDTGIGDVAVASAIALVAVGAVVFSRKRK